MNESCWACGKYGPIEKAHIRSRGAGGSDEDTNILHLCVSCHREQHNLGWDRFISNHKKIKDVLIYRGFKIVLEFGRKVLRRV